MPLFFAAFLLSAFSFATVTIDSPDCPVQFEGRVEEIVKSVGSSSAYSTQSVIFKKLTHVKGDAKDQVAVEMLEHGPIEVEQGEDYRVQLRDGRVCFMEKI